MILGAELVHNIHDILAAGKLLPLIGSVLHLYEFDKHLKIVTDSMGNIHPAVPSPDRAIADGDDLVTVHAPIFCDDVSGACSKQYQKHINVYTCNWSLPSRLHGSSVHFIATSPSASSSELLTPILDDIKYVVYPELFLC